MVERRARRGLRALPGIPAFAKKAWRDLLPRCGARGSPGTAGSRSRPGSGDREWSRMEQVPERRETRDAVWRAWAILVTIPLALSPRAWKMAGQSESRGWSLKRDRQRTGSARMRLVAMSHSGWASKLLPARVQRSERRSFADRRDVDP